MKARLLGFGALIAGWLMLLQGPAPARAGEIACQGVLANSGEEGQTLCKFGTPPVSGMGVVWDAPTGSLWARGGDGVLNRYAMDGRLLAAYPIARRTRQLQTDRLIRVGNKMMLAISGSLYALAIDAPPGAAPTPLNVAADMISQNSVNGAIAIAALNPPVPGSINRNLFTISLYNVETGAVTPLVQEPLTNVRQVELMPNGDLVVNIPGGTMGDFHVSGSHDLHLYHEGREVTDGWPRPSPGANIEFMDGCWWGSGAHETITRFTAAMEPDPGVTLGGGSGGFIGHVDNNEEIGIPSAPVKLRDNLYAVAGWFGVVHLIEWDPKKRQFSSVRRIGALQTADALALNHQGDVWCNSGMWHWNDAPDTPLRNGTVLFPMGQAVILPRDVFTAPAFRNKTSMVVGGNFTYTLTWNYTLTETGTVGLLNGSAVYGGAKGAMILLAINKEGKSQSYRIDPYTGKMVDIYGPVALETATPVKEWTSLAMKDPDTLLGAGDGFIIEMARDGTNWKETKRWNTVPDGTFGSRIYITSDAGRLWLSDTDNQRVLCLNLADGAFVASFGKKGESGNDFAHMDAPRVIEARDNRAVVFDSGNQRLIKLLLSE